MNVIRWFKVICLIISAVCFVSCGNMYGDFALVPDNAGVAQWATQIKSVSESCSSYFNGVAVDDSGNTYAVGYTQSGEYNFGGNNVSFSTTKSPSVIVKYNSSGVAQWATTPVSVSKFCNFNGVVVDKQGNAYAAGYVDGSGTYYFGGESDSFSGKSSNSNAVIVKYNSSGVAQWATPVYSSSDSSVFNSITLDAQGNIYAAGYLKGKDTFKFDGSTPEINGPSNDINAVIVKYNPSGIAQWATAIKTSSGSTHFKGVAADKIGNVYVVGYVYGSGDFDFIGGTDTEFNLSGGTKAVIVKYNSTGVAQWSTPVIVSSGDSIFNGAAVDRFGNVYAAGYVEGSGNFDFGGDRGSFSGKNSGQNAVIVKYDSSGIAQWASPVDTPSGGSYYYGVSVDVLGNAYSVGFITSTGSFYFGGNTSPINGKTVYENTVIVKYNESGEAQWAKTLSDVKNTGDVHCAFTGVAVDGSGCSYAVGMLRGAGEFNFGGKSQLCPTQYSLPSAVIVKYY